jgi:hypothetical protein
MSYDKKFLVTSDPYRKDTNKNTTIRNIYYGEVVSIDDPTEGGRIKVRISGIDDKTVNEKLPWAFPLLPKYFHIYPKVGEAVRVILDDVRYPEKGRQWMGSVISQPQSIYFDSFASAFSTTDLARNAPEKAPSTFPNAIGVFPKIDDIALIGRDNTDVILRKKEIELRAGKHEVNDILSLNKKNPSSIKITIEDDGSQSSTVLIADKIAILSHDGIPKFKAYDINSEEREKIFENGHPMTRGDVLVEALEILRKAIVNHIHGYNGLPADKSGAIIDLEKINFEGILQKNIVIN